MKRRKSSLNTQLFLAFTGILLILILIIGASQNYVMEQYLTASKVSLMESRFHNFMDEELNEQIKGAEQSENHDSEDDSAEGGIVDDGSINSTLKEFKDPKYVLGKLVDRDVGVVYIDQDGKILGKAAFDPTTARKRLGGDSAVYDTNYVPVFSQTEYRTFLSQGRSTAGKSPVLKRQDIYGNSYLTNLRLLQVDGITIGLVQLSTSLDSIHSILVDQIRVFALVSFIILILGAIVIRIILIYTLKPMKDMAEVVEQISVGNLDIRLDEEKGQTEINKLASSFNGMLERMETAFQQELDTNEKMRRFVSDASHELKTPLTSIHGFVEVLLRGAAKDKEQWEQALKSVLMESERLGGIVNDLLTLAKLERENISKRDKVDMNKLVHEIEPQLRVLVGEERLLLDFKTDENYFAYINENHIKQVIYNLVHNGVQHTDLKKGWIALRLKNEGLWTILEIEDNGTGIPEKDIPHIFDRFYRVEGHRSRKQGGNGLGLSIVKSIVDSHEGEISVESELGVGTTFTVRLPKQDMAEIE